MLRSLVQCTLVAVVAVIAYVYLNEFFVYVGEPAYVDSVYGKLKGRISKVRGGRQVYSFTSIPYAKAPVGDLRFEPPVAYGKWEDEVLDATKKVRVCPQYDTLWKRMDGVEDCLQLHIYTPNIDSGKPLLPVLVWIHGGHFMFGGNDIYGPDYLLENGDVVLVAINYRLNSLGFLNTGDSVITGNQGLKDQTMALQWIQRAIRDFGGNPESVTLFGCSAGAASVSYHMVSLLSKGLFHRGISQSGSNLCPFAFTQNPQRQAMRLAEKLNCSADASTSTGDVVKCLRKKPVEQIIGVHQEIGNIFHEVDAIFGPSIEKAGASAKSVFLPESPHKLYKSGKYNKLPWIAGVTSEEGCLRTSLILPNEDKLKELNERWDKVIPKTMVLHKEDPAIPGKIKEFYFGNRKKGVKGEIGWADMESITNMYSDRYFLGGVRDAAILHAQHAPVHLYYYTNKPDLGFGYIQESTPGRISVQLEVLIGYVKFMLYRHLLNWEVNDYGVCHTDEIQSLFKVSPLLNIHENSPHYHFSKSIIDLWISFAKNGKPSDFNGVTWTPLQYDKKSNQTVLPLQYLRLGKVPAMIEEPFTKRMKFWEDLNLPKN